MIPINEVLLTWRETKEREQKIIECFREESLPLFKTEKLYFDGDRSLREERLNHLPRFDTEKME